MADVNSSTHSNGSVAHPTAVTANGNGTHVETLKPVPAAQDKLKAIVDNPRPENGRPSKPKGLTRSQQLNKIYSLPAPLRTFPLPTFIPHNPLSLIQIIFAWASQTIYPPSSHPGSPHQGWLSLETRSVHIMDPKTIRALWEQGFYGKGSLSRSELSWLDREKRRKGASADKTSEEATRQRRVERQKTKWERARKEREAIDQKILEEKSLSAGIPTISQDEVSPQPKQHIPPPTGPIQLLVLPNSETELYSWHDKPKLPFEEISIGDGHAALATNDVCNNLTLDTQGIEESSLGSSSTVGSAGVQDSTCTNGKAAQNTSIDSSKPKSPKSVRFSPTVEQTTFLQSEPPSPSLAAATSQAIDEQPLEIIEQEHLQLTLEEAFFLSYGLGVLEVLDPDTQKPLTNAELFIDFRQLSYFPPPEMIVGRPDDPFLLNYVVYHHYRSLGWVVRGGTKFGVDFLLYNRGPVFSHAEFAIMVLPSYSDPSWSENEAMTKYVKSKDKRTWSWLHCVNRVNSQVKKTVILVYVDIPSAIPMEVEEKIGIHGVLGRYKVREIVLKRWLSNRSRD
jgi:tRNA-splicing endonuclease subunit Sen2